MRASALFGVCQHKRFLFVNKSLYTFWLWTCALSFQSQKDFCASSCFQSYSASSRHQPSCAELLSYVSGITKRALLEGEWGQILQTLAEILPKQCVPMSTSKMLLGTCAEGSWCASLLLGHSFGFTPVESRAKISLTSAQKPSLTSHGCVSLGSHDVVSKGALWRIMSQRHRHEVACG